MATAPQSEQTREPAEVVRAFLDSLASGEIETAVDLLAEDTVWHNVPFPPARGKRKVAAQLRALAGEQWWFTVEFHNVAADGGTVLTERTDGLGYGPLGGEFWVCGTFEVVDGKITLWRDRFDFGDVLVGTVRGTARRLLERARTR